MTFLIAALLAPGPGGPMPHVYRVPEIGNATAVEITWTVLGAIGVAVAILAGFIVARERRAFREDLLEGYSLRRRKAMRRVWRGALRREVGRAIQNGLVLGVGIWAMTQPPITHPTVTTATGLFITGIFFVWISITLAQSVTDYLTRHAVVEILEEDT